MNILVTSVSRKVPLLEALRGAAEGGLVWGADSDPECVGRYFADRFWRMPPLPDADLAGFCSREEIGLVVPTRDGELEALGGLSGGLTAHVAVGAPEAVAVCLDKLEFHQHCEREGIPSVPTAVRAGDVATGLIAVKPRRGAGAKQLAVGLDPEMARAFAETVDDPVFQPVVGGDEHSVDLYVNLDGRVVDAAPRARIRVHDGESVVTETVEHPALVDAAVRFAESLELRGHLVVQAFVERDAVTLLECNPRVGGASALGFAAGIDTPRWAVAEARGETVEPQLGAYRRGLRLVRYPADRLIEP